MRKEFSRFSSPLSERCTPDTCSCEIEPTVEETTESVTLKPFDAAKHSGRVRVVAGTLMAEQRVQTTRTIDRSGKTIANVQHPEGVTKPKGSRLRGSVAKPCPGHIGFTGVLQTQRVKITSVCKCVWQEFWEGEITKDAYYGAKFEVVCPEHAQQIASDDIELKNLREVIIAASREIPTEP